MKRWILSLVAAASMIGPVDPNAHAQDAVCPSPREVAGFRTCADVAKAEQEGKLVIYSTDSQWPGPLGNPGSIGNSTVPAIATHSSVDTATTRPSVFRQLPDPS